MLKFYSCLLVSSELSNFNSYYFRIKAIVAMDTLSAIQTSMAGIERSMAGIQTSMSGIERNMVTKAEMTGIQGELVGIKTALQNNPVSIYLSHVQISGTNWPFLVSLHEFRL